MDITKGISVLGTAYKIVYHESIEDDERFKKYDGWCDTSIKEIHVLAKLEGDKADKSYVVNKILRHEIIHAFMYESGQDVQSSWGLDETLIDFLAIQMPKMNNLYKELNISN